MYRRSRPCHTLSSRPWAGRQNLVYGFSVVLAIRQVGTYIPLSPSLGLSQRAETALLNKSVENSTTTGRFCSRCHLYICACGIRKRSFICLRIKPVWCASNVFRTFPSTIIIYYIQKSTSRKKSCESPVDFTLTDNLLQRSGLFQKA